MINKIKKKLSSNEGFAYIWVCVLIIAITMLVSVVILYMGLMAQVEIQKRDVKHKLDSCVTEYAVEAFEAIKQGENYDTVIDLSKLKQSALVKLGFLGAEESYTYENGNCTMSRPQITTLSGGGFGLAVSYTVSFPVIWNGKVYADLEVPLQVTSYYKFK